MAANATDGLQRPLVFVVDDEHTIADTLALILSAAGFRARAFYSAHAALACAAQALPQVLITDIVMPEMDGFQLAEIMRGLAPDCLIMVISGVACIIKNEAQRLRLEMMQKPVHPQDLLARLKNLLPDSPIHAAS